MVSDVNTVTFHADSDVQGKKKKSIFRFKPEKRNKKGKENSWKGKVLKVTGEDARGVCF